MQFSKTSDAVHHRRRLTNYDARRRRWLLSGKRDDHPSIYGCGGSHDS